MILCFYERKEPYLFVVFEKNEYFCSRYYEMVA